MKIDFSEKFRRKLKKIYQKDQRLYQKTLGSLEKLKLKPEDPSLRLHKLKGFRKPMWSFSVTDDIRILATFTKVGILLIDIGSHDEVY